MPARQTRTATAPVTAPKTSRAPRTPKPALTIAPEAPVTAPTMDAATAKQVNGLESMASKLLAKTMVDLDQLANTVAKLYPLAPWQYATDTRKVMSIAQYARDVLGIKPDGFNFAKFTDARRVIVKAIYQANPDAPTADALAMVGTSGDKTIYRDKDALGLSNPNRQDGGKRSAETAGKTPAAPKAAKTDAPAPATATIVANSLASVRAYILALTNVADLDDLADFIAECRKAVTASA